MSKITFTTIFLLCITAACCMAQHARLSYRVPGKITGLKQKDDMACWITVATMMLSWRDQKSYTVDSVAKKLGDPWEIYYITNTGLPPSEQAHFAQTLRLKSEPPANYTIEAYTGLLKSYGPLWIITGDEFGAHARLIIGIEGDGTYEHSSFLIIDPLKGKTETQNVLKFLQEFEAEAKILNEQKWKGDLRIQIYHF